MRSRRLLPLADRHPRSAPIPSPVRTRLRSATGPRGELPVPDPKPEARPAARGACRVGLPPTASSRARHRWIRPAFEESTGVGSPTQSDGPLSRAVARPGQATVAVEVGYRLLRLDRQVGRGYPTCWHHLDRLHRRNSQRPGRRAAGIAWYEPPREVAWVAAHDVSLVPRVDYVSPLRWKLRKNQLSCGARLRGGRGNALAVGRLRAGIRGRSAARRRTSSSMCSLTGGTSA